MTKRKYKADLDIKDCGEWVEITIRPHGHITKISRDDLWITDIFPKWHVTNGYVKIERLIKTEYSSVQERLFLHRLIAKPPLGPTEIDHINGDRLDNRRTNLRWATRGPQACNRSVTKNRKYTGAYFLKKDSKWIAACTKDGKTYYGNCHDTEIAAAKQRDEMALVLHGEFVRLNFPPENQHI